MENNLDNENFDDGQQTVDNLKPKKRFKKDLDEVDKKIIECVEKDLAENLEEKAAKANLSAKNVKNIIKEVLTNEDVLAYVRSAENPEDNSEPVYEPKYTRAKTKELLSTNPPNILPWASPPKTPSVVHMLFNEELQEDSSGDEYVPENQSNKSVCENCPDVSPSSSKKKANIALRTRSKLSLSHTPLEVIEEAFMPPDITTDMYNMDCDDDVWKEFLKTFTRPLDEVTKAAEDEDHDPEYNVLADEEIDEVDKEELRADRAVTVSRKEFNCLMAELFEFADIYESNKLNEKSSPEEISVKNFEEPQEVQNVVSDVENEQDISIKEYQVAILAQQMRQHVQMLTHNYLLAYENPEFSDLAIKFKEMLMDIKTGSEGKEASVYHAMNLNGALELIANWEHLFATGSKEALECKKYVEKVMAESIQARAAGTTYIVSFPPLLLKTISNSKVFIYPNLLPRIPFRSTNVTRTAYYFFTRSEENLIALFIEQALHYLKNDQFHLTKWKKVNMEHVWELIHRLLMPHVSPAKMRQHVIKKKRPTSEDNPIKYFYRTKKAPPIVHYVTQLDENSLVPPCKRSPETLPYQWRQYLYPNYEEEKRKLIQQQNFHLNDQTIIISPSFQIWPVVATNSVPTYNINFAKRVIVQRRTVGQRTVLKQSTQPTVKKVQKVKQNNIKKTKIPEDNNNISTLINKQTDKMLPDMPNLGTTPIKNTQNLNAQQTASKESDANANSSKEQNLSFKNITTSLNFQFSKPESNTQVHRNFEGISTASTSMTEKDNPDDINEFMRASSTVKTVPRKEPSGAEKKRAKLRREFLANLVMATPDDLDVQTQKEENFADSFFDKLRQTLATDDYNKIIDILAHYDETSDDFVELYKTVLSVLLPKYKELSEEFLLFFTNIQASKVGQLMPYFVMKDMDRFMKKLQIYFKDQPSQMKKIIKCLTDLSENPNLTIEMMKTTILPLFKGNAALTDWFLQIFPCEKPPNLLTSGPHEAIDISKELARHPDEDICETVVLPDTEDPYGGPNCICTCHNVENPQFNSRSLHCKKCGLKFIQGKIYIQTAKALRPAVVSFLTNPEKDHTKRLSAEQRKRSETSPSKQVTSPNKENQTHEEPRHSNESDDECDGGKKKNQRSAKTQKRKVKHSEKNSTKDPVKKINNKEVANSCDKVKSDNAKSSKKSPKRQTKKRNIATKKTPEHKPGSNVGQQKRLAEEPEIEYSEPAELVELKVSSDHDHSGESECEFCDTNTDSDDSSASASHQINDGSKEVPWTREEDKIILQAIRQRNDNEATFKHISEILENRSLLEIKNRFRKLMSLLQEMAAKST